ncbi:hypothetical protein FCM35_KLT05635 [Carex littledalei]|uniref:DUF455 family protein n=1 Tax=Carex littledalei TaxID=544730 RepID=A0A833V8C5_9POAL|nr:hypothetical protein FCM35_KLT05635 [Carex littledalei]
MLAVRCASARPVHPLRHSFPSRLTSLPFSTSSSPCSSSLRPWSGLDTWRRAPPSELRKWGPSGPIPQDFPVQEVEAIGSASSLAELGAEVLSTADPLTKSKLSNLAFSKWRRLKLPVGHAAAPDQPARPDKPVLVLTKEVPSPKNSGLPLNAYMLHNLAHVELNAIDLAWDTVVRFSPLHDVLGDGFFDDFARVADDESRHFGWCSQRLIELGFKYGDMPAHNLLWRECAKTAGDVSARLAAIPLVQEARGLDAGPRLVQKLVGCADHRSSQIVAKIAEEEVAHVAVGVYWFANVCQKLGRTSCSTFKDLLEEYGVELKGPFNYSARDEAGIPRHWYDNTISQDATNDLSKVHDRLACIVAMEKENSA